MKEAYVLCWINNDLIWCVVTVERVMGQRSVVNFKDGSGQATFPNDEIYCQPDLKLCNKVQQ